MAAAASSGAIVSAQSLPAGGQQAQDTTARFNTWLENRFDGWVARSPMRQGYLGLRTSMDKWDNLSEAHLAENVERARRELSDPHKNFGPSSLNAEGKVSYKLYEYESEQRI